MNHFKTDLLYRIPTVWHEMKVKLFCFVSGYNDDDEETETDDITIFVMEDEKEDFSGTISTN